MASIHWIVYIVIGSGISIASLIINLERLSFFFYCGLAFIFFGLIKMLFASLKKQLKKEDGTQQRKHAQAHVNKESNKKEHPIRTDLHRRPEPQHSTIHRAQNSSHHHQGQHRGMQSQNTRISHPQRHAQNQHRSSEHHHMSCPGCRKTVYATYRFCPYCGLRL